MFCCTLLCVHSGFAVDGEERAVCFALFFFLVSLEFLMMPWVCLQFVIVVFPGHTHLLFLPQQHPIYYSFMAVLVEDR